MSIFNQISLPKKNYSTFKMSHNRKFSLNMGELVPTYIQEVLPGDKITVNSSQMLRMMPMIAPIMHKVDVYMHYFFVPNRIMWDGFEDFITNGEVINSEIPLFPTTPMSETHGGDDGTYKDFRLADYLGLPVDPRVPGAATISNEPVSILPFKAYNMIYKEYYADENLSNAVDMDINDGNNTYDSDFFTMKKRAWQHDYFTSALPFAQKGQPVRLPLGGRAQVAWQNDSPDVWRSADGSINTDPTGDLVKNVDGETITTSQNPVNLDNSRNLFTDLAEATATTINDLRRAFSLQRFLEKNARGGSRYVETLLVHFGVRSSDARIQRPEYLGGGVSPIMVSEVLQTSETESSPQGNMAGHGINLGGSAGFSRSFEEWGYVIGIMSIRPESAYQQGLPKHWSRHDNLDFFWEDFQDIGEQEVLNKELYINSANPNGTFGYVPRYADYKYLPSTVHGYLKTTLNFWHLGRIFDNEPTLSKDFIECTPSKRIFAVEDPQEDQLVCHLYHNVSASRLMKYNPSPSIR